MIKTITKQQFRDMSMPLKGQGKEITEAKIELLPVDKGLINGNVYSIEVKEYEDEVILTKIGSKE